jgi:hypothetical protein
LELRRALLLFAIVLGLAAIATSLSRPAERKEDKAAAPTPVAPRTPTVNPRRTGAEPAVVSFSSAGKPRTRLLAANQPGTVFVEVLRPGQVELAGLGLTATAEPLTPARFEVLESRPGRYLVRFSPARTSEQRTVGALRIVQD